MIFYKEKFMFVYIWSLRNKSIWNHFSNWGDVAVSKVRKKTYISRSLELTENATFQDRNPK